ncbi:nicotinate-nucleotide--dimethylbenzimidazole phosphoribosyltransferase [Streptomyces ipomoeae]|uniref:nicotinate-nucleotide--dimethylbenzimidazole phosphoribosyltransferase n=1 Tax=Streptomyces ipomoeae TaxID=103232 RepID=UPI0029A168FE|nr:nicotinate-nucleotide--dimethylbenzimidazole phosphoribosyltransferase [Streptomyces ipomoeae]MDX2932238.1 nicotinate-nucleotide--dimethylbenzimidazole phosphoribosyltransferase [Streptomyces ipomoeae]
MTDTGQVPGEGLPESAGMVEQPGVVAPDAYTYLSETAAEDEELLLPGAQGAWGNEVPPPAPEPVVQVVHEPVAQEQVFQPGPHETSGRDSGSIDLGAVRHPVATPVPQPPVARRPLHMGPPTSDPSASPVRSLADRGPAAAPVLPGAARHAGPPTTGPEYLDVPPPGVTPWGTPVSADATPAPAVPNGGAAAETVVPQEEPVSAAVAQAQPAVAPQQQMDEAEALHEAQDAAFVQAQEAAYARTQEISTASVAHGEAQAPEAVAASVQVPEVVEAPVQAPEAVDAPVQVPEAVEAPAAAQPQAPEAVVAPSAPEVADAAPVAEAPQVETPQVAEVAQAEAPQAPEPVGTAPEAQAAEEAVPAAPAAQVPDATPFPPAAQDPDQPQAQAAAEAQEVPQVPQEPEAGAEPVDASVPVQAEASLPQQGDAVLPSQADGSVPPEADGSVPPQGDGAVPEAVVDAAEQAVAVSEQQAATDGADAQVAGAVTDPQGTTGAAEQQTAGDMPDQQVVADASAEQSGTATPVEQGAPVAPDAAPDAVPAQDPQQATDAPVVQEPQSADAEATEAGSTEAQATEAPAAEAGQTEAQTAEVAPSQPQSAAEEAQTPEPSQAQPTVQGPQATTEPVAPVAETVDAADQSAQAAETAPQPPAVEADVTDANADQTDEAPAQEPAPAEQPTGEADDAPADAAAPAAVEPEAAESEAAEPAAVQPAVAEPAADESAAPESAAPESAVAVPAAGESAAPVPADGESAAPVPADDEPAAPVPADGEPAVADTPATATPVAAASPIDAPQGAVIQTPAEPTPDAGLPGAPQGPQTDQPLGQFVPVEGSVPTTPHLAPTPPQGLAVPPLPTDADVNDQPTPSAAAEVPTETAAENAEPQSAESVATVPTPRDSEAETIVVPQPLAAADAEPDVVQHAEDLDTRGADQEDGETEAVEAEAVAVAATEVVDESAATVEEVPEEAGEEARQPSGPAAPPYDDAEREAVLKVMRERRDIRNGFRSDPIPHDVLLRVLEAAHTAPSVGHSQPWDFVVIRSAETRRTMHELAQRQREAYAKSLPKGRAKQFKELKIEAILDTPVNIVVTADPTRGGRHTLGRHTQPQMAPYSSALAVENLWLAARAEGLGVGWVSFFDEREMVRALGLPEHLEVVAYLCVGYVDEFPEEPELMQAGWAKRRPLSWVVHEETYGRRALPGAEPHDLLAETVAGIRPLDAKALGEAWERQKRMTKPAGALGMLEIISAQLSGLSRQCPPPIPEPAAVAIFAGDHGVHAQGVTPWPQEVTAQMVANFLGGGAVCNAFATQVGAEVCVVDVGVASDLPATPGLLPRKVRAGTSDMTTGPAMTREEAKKAIEVGIETARDLVAAGNKALLTGEMGIANTTASAALIAVFTGADPAEVTGRGTGINDETLARKTEVVRRAIELHQPDPADPIGVLAAIGGFEHAAIVGLLLGGASLRTPVILDGVSAGAAALVARAIAPEVLAACIAGHRSAEPGHVAALKKLGLRPLVDLDLRLGEGTGALLALPVVQSAARAMHEVATFDSAGVTEK